MIERVVSLGKPTQQGIARFLAQVQHSPFTYRDPGATRQAQAPEGFDRDHNRILLGTGEAAFSAACEALKRWDMFRLGWVQVAEPNRPVERGRVVAVMIRAYGMWWTNAARIVYTIDDNTGKLRRFGFAYGTLEEHAECGEERFLIEWNWQDNSVHYDLFAFSRPRHPLAVAGKPLARRLQNRAAKESLKAMEKAVQESR